MSGQNVEIQTRRSASPFKRTIEDDDKTRAMKRHKVEQAQRPSSPRELAPRPANLVGNVATATSSQPKAGASSHNKRSWSLNLKNYPSHHHPVGIAVWILQKVEQVRRELETRPSASYSSAPSPKASLNQTLAAASRSGNKSPPHSQSALFSNHVNVPPAQEQEAERLQAQRNRKTKQRQENWAKNKETDIVARAKIEAKRHFDAFPTATDAEQQFWIEEKVRFDFGRLLDRLAAQLNSEIIGIPPYQIGYADYFFNKATNPQWGIFSDETVHAARLIASVLPALTESVASPQHQFAANALVYALVQNAPRQEAFSAAIYLLAQDRQVLAGLDKLMANLFLPKTGPQLARKRVSTGSDQLGSGKRNDTFSSTTNGAPVWHWKEPATIANSARYGSSSTKASSPVSSQHTNTIVPLNYQDSFPPPIVVQAEIFRPPPPPPGYFQYSSAPNHHPTHSQNGIYTSASQYLESPSNPLNQVNQYSRFYGSGSTSLPIHASRESYMGPNLEYVAPAMPPRQSDLPIGSADVSQPPCSQPRMLSPSLSEEQIVPMPTLPPQPESLFRTSIKSGAETIRNLVSPDDAILPTDATPGSPPRRSSRGTILTSKAKAAGIMLGTQINDVDQSSIGRTRKTINARRLSVSERDGQQLHAASDNALDTITMLDPARSVALKSSEIEPKETQDDAAVVEDFLPRSSRRERKPTAKILASTTATDGPKSSKSSGSVPSVSSKPQVPLSSQSSSLLKDFDDPNGSIGGGKSSHSSSKSQTLPESGQAMPAAKGSLEATIPDNKIRSKKVEKVASLDKQTIQPTAGSKETLKDPTATHLSSKKNEKYLTNDKGQSMSQALLLMAQVAAEWSDSDDESDDEDDSEAEREFQLKLRQAVDRQSQHGGSTGKQRGISNTQTVVPLNQETRAQSIELANASTGDGSGLRRSAAHPPSRHDSNPQGLKGGPPGGRTIINAKKAKQRQKSTAEQRQKSKGPDGRANAGRTNETCNSIPVTREAESTVPHARTQTPPATNFNKSGTIVNFGSKK